MATPVIPTKPASLSNLIENGSVVPETASTPPGNAEAEALVPTAQKPKLRPPVAPKPEGLLVRPVGRERSKSVCTPSKEETHHLRPPITPRKVRTPPPKPPRCGSSEIFEEGEAVATSDSPQREVTETAAMEDEYDLTPFQSSTGPAPAAMEDEYDLTPFQSSTGPAAAAMDDEYDLTPFQSSTGPAAPATDRGFSSHSPAVRAMSYPIASVPSKANKRLQKLLTPTLRPKHNSFESYHELQAKHLPLFKDMSLAELAKKHSKYFPFKIQITEGHYGTSSKYTISTDDRFNLHFMKHMKQVTIQTYGEDYFIPLSSVIQFGAVYDPNDDMTEALEGHRFRRVADLMSSHPLPRLVRVTSSCSCSNGVFLEYNELLVVKKVKRGYFRGKPMLKVFSLLTDSKKLLPEEAIGDFTTKPLCLKMDLSLFLKHVQKRFPIKAMMYYEKSEGASSTTDEEELPPNLLSWPVVLKEVKKCESLVATLEKSSQLIDIPLHGSIAAVRATIVPPNSPDDIEELFRSTHSHLRHFDVTQVDIYGDFSTESAFDAQNTLYRMVRGSVKGLGIEVVTPEALRRFQERLQQQEAMDDDADSFTSSTTRGESPVYALLPGEPLLSDEEYETLEQIRPAVISSVPDLLESQSQVNDRPAPVPTPRRRADTSLSGSGVFRFPKRSSFAPLHQLPSIGHRSVSLVQLAPSEQGRNRTYMRSFTIDQVSSLCTSIYVSCLIQTQVSELLDDMNLSNYKANFAEKQVSGDLLADLSENMLCSDLGVTSDLDRLRLMKIIKGEPSAYKLIKGSPSYCSHD